MDKEKDDGVFVVRFKNSAWWDKIEEQSPLYHTIEDALNRIAELENRVAELEKKFGLQVESKVEIDTAYKCGKHADKWISVKEEGYPRIEDEYKYFLVTDNKGNVSVQEFFVSLDEEPQPYFSGMINVVAWQPLPTPYKGEDKNG